MVQCLQDVVENRQCLEIITNDRDILNCMFGILREESNNINISETINFIITLLKLVATECRIPTMELTDDVTTDTKLNISCVNNTIFGEIILENLDDILAHFPMNNEDESTLIESTHGIKFIPLGFKR